MSKGTNVCKGTLEWKHAHADSRERVLKSNRVVAPIPAAHVYKYADSELPAVGGDTGRGRSQREHADSCIQMPDFA